MQSYVTFKLIKKIQNYLLEVGCLIVLNTMITCVKLQFQITQVIWQYFDESRQSLELYQRKMWLRDALYTVMKGVFPCMYCLLLYKDIS